MTTPAPPGARQAYLFSASTFLCRSFLLSLVFQPLDFNLESPFQDYALYHKIQRSVVPQGNLYLMLRVFSDSMSAGLTNIDGTGSNICNFISHILIKR